MNQELDDYETKRRIAQNRREQENYEKGNRQYCVDSAMMSYYYNGDNYPRDTTMGLSYKPGEIGWGPNNVHYFRNLEGDVPRSIRGFHQIVRN
jgi:hypothetical protein